jgi:AraC-like DNA-binding protein
VVGVSERNVPFDFGKSLFRKRTPRRFLWPSPEQRNPVKVWFTHPAPADVEKYQRAFQSPVSFGQPVNALVLSAVDLATPVRQPDPELFSILERQAQEYLKSLDRSARYVDRVRRVIISLIVDGQPGIDKVSAALKIGPRNLQLKLQAEGMSYQAVLEDVRKHLALRYLADDTVTVSEVSYLLGFSAICLLFRNSNRV